MIATSMRRLEVFLAVVETGRFSQAADRLGIAQPSVSAHIAGLERQIGQSLDQTARETDRIFLFPTLPAPKPAPSL